MKCFQILSGFVHWDASQVHESVADIPPDTYAPDILFVDAPDYVFEGWGYDAEAEGDERFIRPIPPEGWQYDPKTGVLQPIDLMPEPTPPIDPAYVEALETYALDMAYQLSLYEVMGGGDIA